MVRLYLPNVPQPVPLAMMPPKGVDVFLILFKVSRFKECTMVNEKYSIIISWI